MVQKRLPKSLLLSVVVLSFLAFVAVNLHANLSGSSRSVTQTEMLKQKVEDVAERENDRDLSLPDVTVLGRLFELAQRFLSWH